VLGITLRVIIAVTFSVSYFKVDVTTVAHLIKLQLRRLYVYDQLPLQHFRRQ
jgi:hypothetical protein